MKYTALIIGLALSTVLVSCDKEDAVYTPDTTGDKTFKNLDADRDSSGHFTLFSFEKGDTIPLSDSASTKWDIGFRATTIIINSGTSGPGTASGQIIQGVYSGVKQAPTDGYRQDAGTQYAVSNWYTYNSTQHFVLPIAGRVLLFKTANGKYAKMQILSYYKDAKTPEKEDLNYRYYTFNYFYQADGSTQLAK